MDQPTKLVTEVTVLDPGSVKEKISRHEARWRFDDEIAAWWCYDRAVKNGFEARAERVRVSAGT